MKRNVLELLCHHQHTKGQAEKKQKKQKPRHFNYDIEFYFQLIYNLVNIKAPPIH